jgi:hypothetical protein
MMGEGPAVLTPSLRANGSRERAPDDRLREDSMGVDSGRVRVQVQTEVAKPLNPGRRPTLLEHFFTEPTAIQTQLGAIFVS